MAENRSEKLSREELIRRLEELEERNSSLEKQLRELERAASDETEGKPETSAKSKKSRKNKISRLEVLNNVISALITTAAAVVLLIYFAFPVMRVYGSSMSSTLRDGDIVISRKTTKLKRGDICTFYSGSRILCKRVIGVEGDIINIDEEGTVFVNGKKLDEPYLKTKQLGDGDVEFPVTVPDSSYFVLGDNRRISVDSRTSVIGCISEDQVSGRLLLRIMPFSDFGKIDS